MALTLNASQKAVGALSLVDDVTSQPVPATFGSTSASSDNEAVATASIDPDGNVVISGVSEGTANVTVNSIADFSNSLGTATSSPVTTTVAVTVTAAPAANPVDLVITFSAPQPK